MIADKKMTEGTAIFHSPIEERIHYDNGLSHEIEKCVLNAIEEGVYNEHGNLYLCFSNISQRIGRIVAASSDDEIGLTLCGINTSKRFLAGVIEAAISEGCGFESFVMASSLVEAASVDKNLERRKFFIATASDYLTKINLIFPEENRKIPYSERVAGLVKLIHYFDEILDEKNARYHIQSLGIVLIDCRILFSCQENGIELDTDEFPQNILDSNLVIFSLASLNSLKYRSLTKFDEFGLLRSFVDPIVKVMQEFENVA